MGSPSGSPVEPVQFETGLGFCLWKTGGARAWRGRCQGSVSRQREIAGWSASRRRRETKLGRSPNTSPCTSWAPGSHHQGGGGQGGPLAATPPLAGPWPRRESLGRPDERQRISPWPVRSSQLRAFSEGGGVAGRRQGPREDLSPDPQKIPASGTPVERPSVGIPTLSCLWSTDYHSRFTQGTQEVKQFFLRHATGKEARPMPTAAALAVTEESHATLVRLALTGSQGPAVHRSPAAPPATSPGAGRQPC